MSRLTKPLLALAVLVPLAGCVVQPVPDPYYAEPAYPGYYVAPPPPPVTFNFGLYRPAPRWWGPRYHHPHFRRW